MTELVHAARQDFINKFQHSPGFYSQAPGRINIIGEHTDYTGGLSLPAAIDRWTVGAWRKRDDDKIKIYSSNMDELWETSWPEIKNSIDKNWKKYVAGALILFKEDQFPQTEPSGLELALVGNIPLGKGLSSSASIELMVLNGLNLLYGKSVSPLSLTKMAQQVEHQFLKVKSGLLDQFASQFSREDGAILIDFETLEHQPVSAHENFSGYVWVLVDSLVERELANSKYSERVNEYERAKSILADKGLNFRATSSGEAPLIFKDASENVFKRARHIISENERTQKAYECLKDGKVEELGRLLLDTHASLSADYEVSHKNLDFIVEASKNKSGVAGGRMMGGGFGGCCLFLVKKDSQDAFCRAIMNEYESFCSLKTAPHSYNFVGGASAWIAGNEH